MPSFSDNSSAILSSPQVAFASAISRINSRRFLGNGGRPGLRDFQRHKARNAVRCHPMKVSGLTMTRASRQSKNCDRASSASRVVALALRGRASRSWKSASCLRRNRFSARSAERAIRKSRKVVSNRDSTLPARCPSWSIGWRCLAGSDRYANPCRGPSTICPRDEMGRQAIIDRW